MTLAPMRFKNYVWPHNPRVYAIEFRREVAVHKVPMGAYTLQCLGRVNRVLRGEGEFAGPGAYDEFKRLATVFYGNTPGVLVHPVWQESPAYFVRLSLEQEPTEDYVRYSFEFWECCEEYETAARPVPETGAASLPAAGESAAGERWYTAVRGDTLWGVAARHGLGLEALLALNPQIRNPNLLAVGDRVRVAREGLS